MVRAAPGRGAGGVDRGVLGAGGCPHALAPFERQYIGQTHLPQLPPVVVIVAVGAVTGHGGESNPGLQRFGHQPCGDARFGGEVRIRCAVRQTAGRRVRLGVQRDIQSFIGPQRGDGDDPVAGLTESAQPPAGHVIGGVPVFSVAAVAAVAAVADDQHPVRVRRGRRIGRRQRHPPGVDRLGVPHRLRWEILRPLHCRVVDPGHRFGPGQAGQRLVALARQQQPGRLLAKPAPPPQMREQIIETCRVVLQRARCRRSLHTSGHHTPKTLERALIG